MTGLETALPQVSGPAFLIIYLLLGTTITLLAWLWVRADGTQKQPLTRLMAKDPLAISFLLGGLVACKRTIIFSLFEQHLLKIQGQNPYSQREIKLISVGHPRRDQSPVEVRTFNYFQSNRRLKDYFSDKELDISLKGELHPMVGKLEALRLLRTDRDKKTVWVKMAIATISLLVIGSMSTYLGIVHDMPVLGVVILMFTFFAINMYVTRGKNATTLGMRYLQEIKDQFRRAMESAKNGNVPQDVSVPMLVAIFGVEVIPPQSNYAPLREAFHQKSSKGTDVGLSTGFSFSVDDP